MCCRMWSSIPGRYPLGTSSTSLSCTCSVTTKHLSRHRQVFPGWGGRFTPLPHKCSRLFSPYCFQFFFTHFLDLCSVNPETPAAWTLASGMVGASRRQFKYLPMFADCGGTQSRDELSLEASSLLQ